jgi:hypothetical protein
MINTIPSNIIPLLWDTPIENISIEKNKQYIIERVLEYGSLSDDKWLKEVYSIDEIIEIIKKSRKISLKTANFYSIIFNIPQNQIECFKKPFTQKQNRF